MKAMFTSGIFWGIMLLIFGLLVIIKNVYNLDLPVFKIAFGVFLILLGIKVLFFNQGWGFNFDDNSNNVVFGSKEISYTEGENEFNVVFGSARIDLSNIKQSPKKTIELNSVFSDIKIIIPKDVNLKLKQDVVFGSISNPYSNENYSDSTEVIEISIKANAVFGNIEFFR